MKGLHIQLQGSNNTAQCVGDPSVQLLNLYIVLAFFTVTEGGAFKFQPSQTSDLQQLISLSLPNQALDIIRIGQGLVGSVSG